MNLGRDLPEQKRQEILASFGRQGFLRGLRAQVVALAAGSCVIELPFDDAVSQQHGFFHGGALGALADTAGGYAAMTVAPTGVEVLTLDYKIDFLRPAVGEKVVAEAEVLRAGRSVTVTRVDVYACDGDRRVLCAAIQQTIMRASNQDGAGVRRLAR